MDQNRATGPQGGTSGAFEQAMARYTQELMSLYRRQQGQAPRPGAMGAAQPARTDTAAPSTAENSPTPAKRTGQPAEPPCPHCDARPGLTEQLDDWADRLEDRLERRADGDDADDLWEANNTAPGASGTPVDAIGREEQGYLARCAETLARLREQLDDRADRLEERLERRTDGDGSRTLRERLDDWADRLEDRLERRADGDDTDDLWEANNAAPGASGTPVDAIGREEQGYLTRCTETLARLREQAEGGTDRTFNDTTTSDSSQASSKESQGHAPQGTIKTQVFTARRAYPVPGARVELYQVEGDAMRLIDSQLTDQSGQTRPVQVPALAKSLSEHPGNSHPYLSYRVQVSHPDFVDTIIDHAAVFEDVVSIQSVDLIPKAAEPTPARQYIEYPTPEENDL